MRLITTTPLVRSRRLLFILAALTVGSGVLSVLVQGSDLPDFSAFIVAGRAADAGLDPYGRYDLSLRPVSDRSAYWYNLNPPLSVLFFQPLGRIDPSLAYHGWQIASLLIYLLILFLLFREYPSRRSPLFLLWSLSLAGLWMTLQQGQIYLPLVLAAVGAWLLLPRGYLGVGGVLIGLVVAMKPNFIVWPVLLFVAGYLGIAMWAVASACLLSVIPALVYGPGIYLRWFEAQRELSGQWAGNPTNVSIIGLFSQLQVQELGYLVDLVLFIFIVNLLRQHHLSLDSVNALGVTLALLLAPFAWMAYTLFLLPIFFERPLTGGLRVAAVLLAVPYLALILLIEVSPGLLPVFRLYSMAVIIVLLSIIYPYYKRMRRPA